jgi:serine/threonine protein kinase
VHRDLKPSNILVTAGGIPKLLDFGIARMFDPGAGERVVEQTISTRSLMRPEYASPEQVRGEPATPASDIYSLGVLLYEMLTRQRPYRVDKPTPQKIAEAVCEQEPERPSTAVTRPRGGTAKEAFSTPRLETGLARKLRGDLDNIVLMALRKEPERRYAGPAHKDPEIIGARPSVEDGHRRHLHPPRRKGPSLSVVGNRLPGTPQPASHNQPRSPV